MRSFFWAATWGLGAAIGVAVGGWLTVAGGAGSLGVESLDLVEDLLVLPVLAGLGVIAIHLIGQAAVAIVRGSRAGDRDSEDHDGE